ncbi:MAG: dihydroorotase [Deltaproteobacteria bacterium]|jgi:dihydroorotase|nr:dihydroorotase [Deltaproteobacteria bacterium]MBT6504387.1 dihydroorotase [Deltaproteobacteria bacterium]MBT7712083.1 dihydroorotase [Deltaproteobacteria bacterium]
MKEKLTLTQPDDWHLHLRDGAYMAAAVQDSARWFGRALVMPNLAEPVRTVLDAAAYRDRIIRALPEGSSFQPLMTLYLTASTPAAEIESALKSGFVQAIKLFPAGATTLSEAGIRSWREVIPVLEKMQKTGMPLSVHGEVTDATVDIFDREKVFVDTVLTELVETFPELRIVLEHLSTKEAVQFIEAGNECLAATITAHHLLLNRNDLLVGGIKPHYYCLPIVKKEVDRQALLKAATSGNPKFFLGTDSAPHAQADKEAGVGKAGIYSAPSAISLYADVFESTGRIDRLEGFASFFGPDFYRIPRNRKKITLEKGSLQEISALLDYHDQKLVSFRGGQIPTWQPTEFDHSE